MKKAFILAIGLLLSLGCAVAQVKVDRGFVEKKASQVRQRSALAIKYGVKAGANLSGMSNDMTFDPDFSMGTGFHVGALVNFHWGQRTASSLPGTGLWGLQPELLFSNLNPDFSSCCQVQLLLPILSDESFDYLKGLLSERFQAEDEGKYGPNTFTYLQPGVSEQDSKYRVALERRYNEGENQYTYFLSYNLRSEFYPQEEGLWIDFTTLFGSDKNKVRSTMEGYGCSFSFSDNSYSANGSDYYYIKNNDYADVVGFVFNVDNQVSQFWVYYKPSKISDVYNYLTRKYTAAENEKTESVDVFYNGNRDLKVVLDQINGAVIYTKLDMKQHETPA